MNRLLRSVWSHFLMPLYRAARVAKHVDKLDQSAWQRGWSDVERWARNSPIPFTLACAPLAGAFGVLGPAVSSELWAGVLLAAFGATLGLIISVGLLACAATLRAPYRQRNEARTYARALNAHAHQYAEWARRREIAEDFLRETFGHRDVIIAGNDPRTPEDLESHWRATVKSVAAMMQAHGASANELTEIRNGLAGLDASDDGYGDDHRRRIWNNMGVISQNLRTVNRAQDPPNSPDPPGDP